MPPFNLETAVQDGKVMQDFELESLTTGGEHSQMVKAPRIVNDYGSKSCVNLPSSNAVSRFNKKKILGIDPGTVITGYGIIDYDDIRYEAIDYGCIRPPKTLKLTERFLIISNGIEEIIEKHAPDVLVVETQFVQKNVQSAIKLGMARGIAIIAAKKRGLSVFEYAPTQAKLAVVGNGKASKEQVQNMVKMLLKLPAAPTSTPEDVWDALSLAICHAHRIRYNNFLEMEI